MKIFDLYGVKGDELGVAASAVEGISRRALHLSSGPDCASARG
ncbi:hypothetical protein [Corallococcus macrosporus]|nr:hypothetical protein [Corallococcus macrosporus]